MMTLSRLIGGISGIVVGLFLIVLSFFVFEAFWVALIYGLIIFGVGFAILINFREDKIEEIIVKKSIKSKRGLK